ncbi:hypothetical protein BC829DRAFT_473780 [Chytridium lagenaria]|nr:hypothetical protein BC829DRAFT_473780 [Chytridium lagenaria]
MLCVFVLGVEAYSGFFWSKDSPAWCDGGGGAQVDRMMYPTPHNWEWVTDWTLEVNGDVDPDGWTYSHHFNSKQWSGVCSLTHYVRRRSWSRTRRRTGFDASETHSESQSRILELPSLLRARPLDRQKLDLLQSTLFEFPDIPVKTYTVLAILNEFQFDKYRLQAAIGMLKKVPEEDVLHLLKPFRFHADKISVMEARKTL